MIIYKKYVRNVRFVKGSQYEQLTSYKTPYKIPYKILPYKVVILKSSYKILGQKNVRNFVRSKSADNQRVLQILQKLRFFSNC